MDTVDTVERLERELHDARAMIANLETALASNRHIGVAIGIVMARHGIDQDAAFERIRLVSQRTHRKLRDVAADVVTTGDLPPAG